MSEKICIAASSDEGYAMPITVALHSAASQVSPDRDVVLYVLDAGIKPETRARSEACLAAAHPKVSVEWVVADTSDYDGFRALRYTVATYLRMMVPDIISPDIDRLLYIDCDVVVDDDVSKLWALDFAGAPFLAVANPPGTYFHDRIGTKVAEVSAPADAPYFNAGVLLMNLPAWRDANVSQRALDILKKYDGQLSFLDQDALNAVSVGAWGQLEERWNAQAHRMKMRHKSVGITHYTSHKPWSPHYTGARANKFFRAYFRSGWDTKLKSAMWIAQRFLTQNTLRNKNRMMRYLGLKTK